MSEIAGDAFLGVSFTTFSWRCITTQLYRRVHRTRTHPITDSWLKNVKISGI